MKKEELNLSEKIEENGEHLREPYLVIPLKDVKEKVQSLQEELKEKTSIAWYEEWKVEKFIDELNKAFLKHIGKRLLK